MKRFMYLSVGLLCLSLSAVFGFHVGHRTAYGSADIVKAKKFVLINSEGEAIGEWALADNQIMLSMKDRTIDSPSVVITAGGKFAGVTWTSKSGSGFLSGSTFRLSNQNDRSNAGDFWVKVQEDGTWVSLAHSKQAGLELVEQKYASPPRQKVIIGNAELHWFDNDLPILERPASSLIHRPMSSIVVLGDSVKVKIP